jgi:excisionase family DNA binding protein
MMGRALLTITEAADTVGVSTRTVRRWVAAGLLVAYPGTPGRTALYLDRAVFEAERAARQLFSRSAGGPARWRGTVGDLASNPLPEHR